MTSEQPPQKPLLASAPIACSACRRLKMRCVGAEDPPCARCARTGRRCVVTPSRRGQQQPAHALRKRVPPTESSFTNATHLPDTHFETNIISAASKAQQHPVHLIPSQPSPFRTVTGSVEAQTSPASLSYGEHRSSPSLPSLYSSTPLEVLGSVATQQLPAVIRSQRPYPSRFPSLESADLADLPDTVLVEHIEFFREKILYYVPVIDHADLEDARHVIEQRRPLALCVSFVASQFIPGSTSIRQRLLSQVSDFVKSTAGPLTEDENVLWTQLQALAILYAYRPAGDVFALPGTSVSSGRLNHWDLKYSIEAFALRTGLHRSIDGLRARLQHNPSGISKTLAYHRYVYWLWLVTMSHHFSLMTRTPPTLREDSSISSAVDLLRDIPRPSRVTRILGEIDLYMLWQRAGRSAPGLAEWWCTPSDTLKVEEVMAVLDDLEGALEVWSHRWGLRGEPQATISNVDISKNTAVNFHFQATRFSISTFETRYILEKAEAALDGDVESRHALSHLARQSVLKSVTAAHRCTRCLMDLPPLRRENIRYMAEFGYVLIAFCCVYIVQAYKTFGTTLPVLESFVPSVEEVATLMTEMAVANHTAPRIYGLTVLLQLTEVMDRGKRDHVDSQARRERRVETVDDYPAASSLSDSLIFPSGLDVTTSVEDRLTADDPQQSPQLKLPSLSPWLFSIFEPGWKPLLR